MGKGGNDCLERTAIKTEWTRDSSTLTSKNKDSAAKKLYLEEKKIRSGRGEATNTTA